MVYGTGPTAPDKKTEREGNYTMKRILFLIPAVVLLVGLSGCCCNRPAACGDSCTIDGSCSTCVDCPETCQSYDCDGGTCDSGTCDGGMCDGGMCDGGTCVQDCGYATGRGQGLGDRCRGFLSGLCPWGRGCGNRAAAGAGDGAFGQGASDGAFGQGTGGVVTYPYYTTRGPRDFLAKNPRGIGP